MTAEMTSRERVLAALSHRKVDRIPIDIGGTHNSTICRVAYENLKDFLGISASTLELSKAFESIRMDEAVLRLLPVDTRPIFIRPPAKSGLRWLNERTFVDEWGVTYRQPENWPQYDMICHPLAEATIEDLEDYPWPDVEDESRHTGLRDEARDLHENTNYAVRATTVDTVIFDRCWALRGMERFLTDLYLDPEFNTALMEKVAQIQLRRHELFLEQVGLHIDIIMIADDMGTQSGFLLRPDLYRKMVKPFHKRYVEFIKEHTDAKVAMRCCGGIVDLIEDYIEIGVDVLNPMQVTATNMMPSVLKERFSGRMAFWEGIDTQELLPNGSPQNDRRAVRETLDVMDLDGGYILSAAHNIQDDVPPENVWTMLDEAASYRRI